MAMVVAHMHTYMHTYMHMYIAHAITGESDKLPYKDRAHGSSLLALATSIQAGIYGRDFE